MRDARPIRSSPTIYLQFSHGADGSNTRSGEWCYKKTTDSVEKNSVRSLNLRTPTNQ